VQIINTFTSYLILFVLFSGKRQLNKKINCYNLEKEPILSLIKTILVKIKAISPSNLINYQKNRVSNNVF